MRETLENHLKDRNTRQAAGRNESCKRKALFLLFLFFCCAFSFLAGRGSRRAVQSGLRSEVVQTPSEAARETPDGETSSQAYQQEEISEEGGEAVSSLDLPSPVFLYRDYVEDADAWYAGLPLAAPDRLNLADIFPEDSEALSVSESMAGRLYNRLTVSDSQWYSGLYDLYNYTPVQVGDFLASGTDQASADVWTGVGAALSGIESFDDLKVRSLDGEGADGYGTSNARAIVAMCNVLSYYGVFGTPEEMELYANSLWQASHEYTVALSEVTYCDGSCLLGAETATPSDAAKEDTLCETPSDAAREMPVATPSEPAPVCPGHVTLSIDLIVRGTGESSGGLFSVDTAYALAVVKTDETGQEWLLWPGWNEETISFVTALLAQDWYGEYGLNAVDLTVANPLSSEAIEFYMQLVPEEASLLRKDLVRYALASVGKIPYYWGGKPARPGYTGNRFGSIVAPDESGRFLKGLDCSGWVNWVYWSVTGHNLGAEGTATLISAGIPVTKEGLMAGDICIRLGESPHAVMFLGWAPDGRMVCIQETSAFTNNVEVALVDPDWTGYRRFIE